jgi:hypothetical protein
MPDQVAPTNKAVKFRGRAQREYARLPRALAGKGRISARALKRFQKEAGHNPPKPYFTQRVKRAPLDPLDLSAGVLEDQSSPFATPMPGTAPEIRQAPPEPKLKRTVPTYRGDV